MERGVEQTIIRLERELRDWFTQGKDKIMMEIDGLDIGWGGSQRCVTAAMPDIASGEHLDFACGYGTFLAQVGWRFQRARLFGLNIDYAGPHACITRLLRQAGVRASLVQADACKMPFKDQCFGSVSCFLGLQDIKIGFGDRGLEESISEAVRVLRPGGYLLTFSCSHHVREDQFYETIARAARDIRKSFQVIYRFTQPPDHAPLLTMPETRYFKGMLLRQI